MTALYMGTLRHRRQRPTAHAFTYSTFMVLLDIDQLPATMARSPWTSYNRFNWASFDERDHLPEAPGATPSTLRERLANDAALHGVALSDGPVYLLTNLRYWGYCFNTISIYYCYPSSGGEPVVMAEVTSTFGERKNYWLDGGAGTGAGTTLHRACPKQLHVSPFMPMDLHYNFALTQPGETLAVHMNVNDAAGRLFDATLSLQRQEWTSVNLTRGLLRHPWLTAKVTAAIHWEAARLWWKGTPVHTHPLKQGGNAR